MNTRMRVAAAPIVALALSFGSSTAIAQVDCSNPDNLCTGDPCVTTLVDVISPCIADFSPRTLVIAGPLRLPNGGMLQLTAGNIEVSGIINGAGANGSQITLTSAGNINVHRLIDSSGRLTSGSVTLDAGGVAVMNDRIVSRPKDGPADGGTITIHADGNLIAAAGSRFSVRATKSATGGQVQLSSDSDLAMEGLVDARGGTGGTFIAQNTTGTISINEGVRLSSKVGAGGNATLTSSGGAITTTRRIDTGGSTAGGTVTVQGDSVTLDGPIDVDARHGIGGTADITAGAGITISRKIDGDGDSGGCVRVVTTTGDLLLEDNLEVRGDSPSGPGGRVVLDSAGAVIADDGDIEVRGFSQGGSISLSGAALLLGGDFEARGVGGPGGTIEGSATADITANGDFDARDGGCIAFSAGGTATLSGDFDPAPVGSCPPPVTTCPF